MAKDTAEEPGIVDWGALQELKDAGLSNDDIRALSQSTTSRPGAAELSALDAAKAEYKTLLDAYQSDPNSSVMGGTSNETYTALKLAQKAKADAANAYYKALRGTTDDPFRYNPRINDETAYFTDPEGNFGLGLRPENTYYNDYSGTMVEGQGQVPTNAGSALPGGGGGVAGPGDARPPIPGGQDPFTPPPNYNPEGGNGLPNGGIPNDSLLDSAGRGYHGLVTETLGHGGGAGRGPAGNTPLDRAGLLPDRQGYESASNKDFYQRQFQEMMGQQTGQKLSDLAAAVRRQEAAAQPQGEPFGGDPWSWANLPEVRMGSGISNTPDEYSLNQRFDWGPGTSNQDILNDLMPTFNESTQVFLNKHPEYFSQGPNWVDSRENLQDWAAANPSPNDKGWTTAINKIGQNVWQPVDGGISGPSAPTGYALPV